MIFIFVRYHVSSICKFDWTNEQSIKKPNQTTFDLDTQNYYLISNKHIKSLRANLFQVKLALR